MKTKLLLIVSLVLAATLIAQPKEKNHLFTLGETNLGGYVALGGKYTTVNSDNAGILDIRAALTFDSGWAIGLGASGFSYDKKLNALVTDGTYHLEAGYAGLFVEKIFSITDDLKFSASVLMASGLTKYRYDKDFRKNKTWVEETIDQTTFFVTEPGIEITHRIAGNWWIALSGSYRLSSPVEMIGTDEEIFKNFGVGINLKYGLF